MSGQLSVERSGDVDPKINLNIKVNVLQNASKQKKKNPALV